MAYKNMIERVQFEDDDHLSSYDIEQARKELQVLLDIPNGYSLDMLFLKIIDPRNIPDNYMLDIIRERLLAHEDCINSQ